MRPLRVLLVEDDPKDAQLICLALEQGGFEPRSRCVETADGLRSALADQPWDLVLSDYSLPALSGPDAFVIVRDSGLDVPFLIVSGPMGEEVAVQAMRAGVHDCLLKEHLERLVIAVERELREAAIRIERRNVQEQLLIAEQMAWFGALAAGLVHEINNPLSVISGNLQVLEGQFRVLVEILSQAGKPLPPNAAAAVALFAEAAADAAAAARRVQLLTRDLRQFSHPDESKLDPVDVHKVLEWSIRMTQNAVRGRFQLVRQFGDVPPVKGRTAALAQLFAYLLAKAAQATPHLPPAPRTITLVTSCMDGMVAVDLIDSGTGVAADALPHARDLVTEMGGRVQVLDVPGGPANLRVLLPQAPPPAPAAAPMMAAASMVIDRRSASVLVIDDEPALGRVLPRLLAPHSVTVVERAQDALERLRTGGRFDVILCDVMMPEMNGMQFHQELLRDRPEVARRVIFMSGGVFSPSLRAFFEGLPNHKLEKPLDLPALRRLIDETAWS